MSEPSKKQILKEGKFLRLVQEGRWEWVERVNCTGVVGIVAMTEAGKVLLVEQYRASLKKPVIELPAGLVGDEEDREESLETAARRELLEETGYEAKKIFFLTEGPPSSGMSPEVISIFRAEGLIRKHGGGGSPSEAITVHEIALDQAEDWLERQRALGKLVDPKVYAGLYFLTTNARSNRIDR